MQKTEDTTGQSERGAHRVGCLARCPREFAYNYLLHLQPNAPRKALARGTLVHMGIEAHYLGHNAADAINSCPVELAFMAAESHRLVQRYVARYPVQRDSTGNITEEMGTVVFVEREFRYYVGGVELLTRRLDLGIERNGYLYILDHKTAARPSMRAASAMLDLSMFTQEIVGAEVAAAELGLRWGGLYLNLVPSSGKGEHTRPQLSYTNLLLSQAKNSLLYWLTLERNICEAVKQGTIDPWSMAQSFQCYPNGFMCDYWRLCRDGDTAMNEYHTED